MKVPALGRALAFLAATTGLAACVADPNAAGYNQPMGLNMAPGGSGLAPGTEAPGRRVAILVPLTGPNAEVGQALLRAAQLSLDQPGGLPLDARDTRGTPAGAAEAARTAMAAGAGIILGPLTAGETGAVAPLARAAGVPVLAFTSDVSQAQPGVWTLGITPGQQVRRLVLAVRGEGKTRLGAVVPQNAFGDALSAGMVSSATEAGLPPPQVLRYGNGFTGLNASLKEVSNYAARHGGREPQGRPADDAAPPPAPGSDAGPPVDALLLGAAGSQLGQAAPLLAFYDIGPAQVRILGPATWAREATTLGALAGAWYAAPDPSARVPFEQTYASKYGAPPRDLASIAYDAAGVARASLDRVGYSAPLLLRPQGYVGADGPFRLLPDGQVQRSLAIFEIDRGSSHIVQPAQGTLGAPGT
jgi:branched-chain amino acid transport system substrate-binding protein